MSESPPLSPWSVPSGSPPANEAALAIPEEMAMPVRFTGIRREFLRLVLHGGLLELVTAGFYRFWLATDMRRHLWSHTVVDGDGGEYTGQARELLIGFLIAMAILTPLYIGYFLLGLEAERLQAFASIPLLLLLYLLGLFASYRARRYRLTRTVWRGVRFWMKGSGTVYALRGAGWMAVVVVTLGLALPWRHAALERYKLRHSFYGTLPGHFVGSGWGLFKQVWWIWLLTALIGWLVLPLPFLYAAYRAALWRWWVSGIQFGPVYFSSTLRRGALIGLYWKVIGWALLLTAAFSVYVGGIFAAVSAFTGRDAKDLLTQRDTGEELFLFGALGVGYLVALVFFNVALRLYLTRDVWQRVAEATAIRGFPHAGDVAAHGDVANALGEGLSGDLDVAGF